MDLGSLPLYVYGGVFRQHFLFIYKTLAIALCIVEMIVYFDDR